MFYERLQEYVSDDVKNGDVINHRYGPKASMKEQHAKSTD